MEYPLRDHHQQANFSIKFDWGMQAVKGLAPVSDVMVIVDVFPFTSTVSVALDRGVAVLPYRWKDDSIHSFARERDAIVGLQESGSIFRPSTVELLEPGARVVIPSPNGATQGFRQGFRHGSRHGFRHGSHLGGLHPSG